MTMLFCAAPEVTLRAMNDQHVIAIATIVQVVLLFLNAALIFVVSLGNSKDAASGREAGGRESGTGQGIA